MTEEDYYELHRDMRKDDAILHTPHPGKPITLTPDEQHMIVGAMRNAQGRSDYVVRRTTRFVIDHWEELSEHTRYVLTRDAGVDLHMRQEETPDQAAHYRRTNPNWETYLDHLERTQQ